MTDTNNTQQLAPSAQKAAPVQKVDALTALTKQLGLVDQEEVYNIMMKTVMPSGASYEELAAFCMTASAYKLNPLIKEIHAFRAKSGGIQPMVGIDGWLKLVHANPDFDGMEHEYAEDKSWVECRIYSKSKSRPTIVREYMEENRVESSPVWKQRPLRMLRHRATIQAVRYFMGIGGLADREEFIEFDQANSSPVNVQARVVKPSFLELAQDEADEIPGLEKPVEVADPQNEEAVPTFGQLI
jgi:phage recombination protein Bet